MNLVKKVNKDQTKNLEEILEKDVTGIENTACE